MNNKLKDFNRERALSGDPVVTRAGYKILNIVYFPEAPDNSKIIAVVQSKDDTATVFMYYIDGKMWGEKDGNISDWDLLMAPIEKECWVASGKSAYSGLLLCTNPTDTEEGIKRVALGTRLIPESIQFHKITRLE